MPTERPLFIIGMYVYTYIYTSAVIDTRGMWISSVSGESRTIPICIPYIRCILTDRQYCHRIRNVCVCVCKCVPYTSSCCFSIVTLLLQVTLLPSQAKRAFDKGRPYRSERRRQLRVQKEADPRVYMIILFYKRKLL